MKNSFIAMCFLLLVSCSNKDSAIYEWREAYPESVNQAYEELPKMFK